MKRIVPILLICVYSLSSFGVSLKAFYCCGRLKSVSVTYADKGENKCGKGNNTDSCCKTKYQSFKVNDNHFTSDNIKTPSKQFISLTLFTPSLQDVTFYSPKIILWNRCNAPPIYSAIPAYIYNCVFRI